MLKNNSADMKRVALTAGIIAVVAAGFLAALELYKTITIVVNGQATYLEFWGFNTSDALVASGIKLHEGDRITPGLEEYLHENSTVVISPAFWVTIFADGESRALWTAERRPDKILELASISLNPGDEIWSNGIIIDPSIPLPYESSHALQVRRTTTISLESNQGVQTIHSNNFTLGEALSEAGIPVYNEDSLTPSIDTPLTGQEIYAVFDRSREIIISTKSQEVHARVRGYTVGEVLSRAGLPLQGLDYSIPAEDQPVPDNGRIRVIKVRETIYVEQEPIPFSNQYQPLSQVDLDSQQIVQVGEYGIKARRIRVLYEDDQEVSQTIDEEWIAKEPKPRIIGYGTNIPIRTVNTPNGVIQYWRAVDVFATSYSPCRIGQPDQCSYHTASGTELKKGVIGVIRSWYNAMQGQAVYIPGYGFATIEDIGGGYPGRRWIDLGYSDEDWVSWSGSVTVYFLTPVPENILYLLE
jgi:uncharacterized protein YabE (DUF348 family)